MLSSEVAYGVWMLTAAMLIRVASRRGEEHLVVSPPSPIPSFSSHERTDCGKGGWREFLYRTTLYVQQSHAPFSAASMSVRTSGSACMSDSSK